MRRFVRLVGLFAALLPLGAQSPDGYAVLGIGDQVHLHWGAPYEIVERIESEHGATLLAALSPDACRVAILEQAEGQQPAWRWGGSIRHARSSTGGFSPHYSVARVVRSQRKGVDYEFVLFCQRGIGIVLAHAKVHLQEPLSLPSDGQERNPASLPWQPASAELREERATEAKVRNQQPVALDVLPGATQLVV